jgi:hypothetical protein
MIGQGQSAEEFRAFHGALSLTLGFENFNRTFPARNCKIP